MLKKTKGDITKAEADVIINAANTKLHHAGGVAWSIAKAAGTKLVQESRKIGYVPLGEFTVTTAGDLKAKKVVHIPTIDYQKKKTVDYKTLEEVLKKVFRWCKSRNYTKIATPLLGTGVVGLDKDKVEKTIDSAQKDFPDLTVIIYYF